MFLNAELPYLGGGEESSWLIAVPIIVVLVLLLPMFLFVVKQQTNYIIERFGKFHKVAA